jgi:hypothetical protein
LSTYATLKNIFKVIYAPVKAFSEIIQNPRYLGPVLIMVLFAIANMGFIYAIVSKTLTEQTVPTATQKDMWTENATLWTGASGVNITENFVDFINGTYYGNRSMEFSTINSSQISMQLDNLGSINCSGSDGYKNLYLRIKRIDPNDAPENMTIYLFSATPSDYFYYNPTAQFSNSTLNVWNNLTIQLDSPTWNSNANASWEDIKDLKLEFGWPNNSNITLLVDGLFFGGVFKSPVDNVVNYMVNASIVYSFLPFLIEWIFLGALLYILAKGFKAQATLSPFLIAAGFAMVTLFIQAIINAVLFSTLPTLYYRFQLIGGVRGESENAYNADIWNNVWLVSQISGYVQIAVYFWTTALSAVATRLLTQFSWSKSFLIATVAYFATIILQGMVQNLFGF